MPRAARIAISLIGIIGVAIGLLVLSIVYFGDGLDTSRVIGVNPSPDGSKAAVIAVQKHSESSTATVRLSVARAPFPSIGDSFDRRPNVILANAFRSDATNLASFKLAWSGTILAICIDPARLLHFAADERLGESASVFDKAAEIRLEPCEGWDRRHPTQ